MEKKRYDREKLNTLDKEILIELILNLAEQNERLTSEVSRLNEKMDILIEQIATFHHKTFGKSSEKNLVADGEQIVLFFNEPEALADPDLIEPTIKDVVPSYTRKRKVKGKRDEDLKNLPCRVENHELSEESLHALFPGGYRYLPDEIYRKLEFHPATFEVVEHHIKVYRDKKSDQIAKASHPKEMLDKSIATPSLAAAIIHAKYINSLPLYRQEQEFLRNDIHIARQNMANWMIKVSERHLSLLYDAMKDELLKSPVIHADETPVSVTKDGREGMHKNYMWVYRSGTMCDAKPVVLYEYQKTRKLDFPREFLGSYEGNLVCDGYQVYHSIEEETGGRIRVAGCLAHARRKFADVVKSLGKEKSKGTLAEHALVLIAQIYHKDNKLLELSPDERAEKRKTEIAPLMDSFFDWARAHIDEVPANSNTCKGLRYCLNQEKYLRRFLENPEIPLDNNAAELAIRSFCIGKNNWKLIDTVNGAKASAIMYSVSETVKANHIKPYNYFNHVLTEIPKHMDDTNLAFLNDLLPWSDKLPEDCHKPPKTT